MELDLNEVNAGDDISQQRCEELLGINRASDMYRYQFELLQLCTEIRDQLWKIGKRFTVIIEDGMLRVLSHAEAAVYNARQFENARKSLSRYHRRMTAIDTSQLDGEQLKRLDETLVRQSRMLQMMRKKPESIETRDSKVTNERHPNRGDNKTREVTSVAS